MQQYITFLRAINVGGRFVKMDDLRQAFESLGFSRVETYIQSGNMLFESPATNTERLENEIEAHLEKVFGFRVPAFIRTDAELLEIAEYWPFKDGEQGDGFTLYISFLRDEPSDELQRELISSSSEIDEFHVHGRQVFWLSRRQLGKSTFTNAMIEKTLATQATRRNANTIRKIVKKYLLTDGGDEPAR
jgi:uncharacterized protein (DUF1697 family)